MAELTADQQAQAGKLNGTMPWVYPDTSNAAFWNNYFNPQPTLTADEQASGISIGPADSSYYTRPLRQTSTPTPQVLPGVTQSSAPTSYTFQPTSGTVTQPRMLVGSNPTAAPVGESGTGNWSYGGDGDYQSSLIKSLRESSPAAPETPGVRMLSNVSWQDITNALDAELTARPGASYADLERMATTYYGASPEEFKKGWDWYQSSGPVKYDTAFGSTKTPGLQDFGKLSMNVQPIASGRTNPTFSYSTQDINQALIDEVRARPGSTYDELLNAAEDYGVTVDEFNTAFANMGFTDAGIADMNQDEVINAADLSSEDIAKALSEELAARPGSSYQDLLNVANTVYGISPDAFKAGWDVYKGVPVNRTGLVPGEMP